MATAQHNTAKKLTDWTQKDAGSSADRSVDVYFSADVETDGPIPGPFSILSFALVFAGVFDGGDFLRPEQYSETFYRELKPISENFEPEALRVNGLDRARQCIQGEDSRPAMTAASRWVSQIAGHGKPVLVAYPLSFDWAWLYWYFIRFSSNPHRSSATWFLTFWTKSGKPITDFSACLLYKALLLQ